MDLLLVLFDEILMDEYAEGCEDFDTLSDGDTHCYTCDFCGADIFQSCFGCVDCAQNYDDSGTKDPLLICPGCYAEGRTCLHGIMTPYQCQPFDTLLLDRDDAVKQMNKISPSKSRRQLNSGYGLVPSFASHLLNLFCCQRSSPETGCHRTVYGGVACQ